MTIPTQLVQRALLEDPAREPYGVEIGVPPAQQRRHASRVLTRAWALRTALSQTVPAINGGTVMIVETAKPFTCRLNLHTAGGGTALRTATASSGA